MTGMISRLATAKKMGMTRMQFFNRQRRRIGATDLACGARMPERDDPQMRQAGMMHAAAAWSRMAGAQMARALTARVLIALALVTALTLGFALPGGVAAAKAQGLGVVTSIKPVHSLVARVMAGVGEPYLIVRGASSPHNYALRPNDAKALSEADLVFWIGSDLEPFLQNSLQNLAPQAEVVTLQRVPGLRLLGFREAGPLAAENQPPSVASAVSAEETESGIQGEIDPHVWLDPDNTAVLVAAISDSLSARDPANAARYQANAAAYIQQIQALTGELTRQLAPVADQPFVVFHDGFQYFEKRFNLRVVGSITVNPAVQPGARRVDEIQQRIRDLNASCIFSEPQFDTRRVRAASQDTGAKLGQLDPLGSKLDAGPGLYEALMRDIVGSLLTCLS
jgi:zinc transport system substrate-binding protein